YEVVLRRLQEVGNQGIPTATVLNNLGLVRFQQGRYANAADLYRGAAWLFESLEGTNSAVMAQVLTNLGNATQELGQYLDAERLIRRALAIQERLPEVDRLARATTMESLATVRIRRGSYAEAERLLLKIIEIRTAALGPAHRLLAKSWRNLGEVYSLTG